MKWKNKLIFLLFASFLLRLISLNQSLWLDEATTARVVQQFNYGQILTLFSPHDFHPPLYYLFMKLWTNIFGYSEIALRMPSVLASLATGWVLYLIVKTQKSVKSIALWATAFFLFNPLVVYYSQEARMYSIITLLVTLIFWSVTKLPFGSAPFGGPQGKQSGQDTGFRFKGRELIFANVFIALALGTYYGSIFFIAALYGYLLLKKKIKLFAFLLPGTLVAGIFLYPLFLTQLKNSGEVLQAIPNWSTTLGKANLKNLVLFPIKFTSGRISWDPKIYYFAVAGLWAVIVWFACLKNILNTKYRILYTAFFLPILLGFLVSFYKPLLQYFRFIYVIPFMSILLAYGANKKWQRVVLLIGFVAFSLIYTYIPSFHREDWKSLAASLPSDTVCALPSAFDPLQYYRPSLKTIDARSCATGNADIVFVPYVAQIYGFDYAKYFNEKKYSLTKEVSFRGVSYQQWSKK